MSLLTAFTYVFTADTRGLDSGVAKAEKSARGLSKEITTAEQSTQKLTHGFRGFLAEAAKTAGVLLSAGAVLRSFSGAAQNAEQLQRTAQALRVGVADLDAWGSAAERAGGTASGMHAAIKTLGDGMHTMRMTGGGEMAYLLRYLGVGLRDVSGRLQTPIELLPKLADRLRGMSAARGVAIGKALGFDDATISVLRQGGGALDELIERQRALGVVTEKDTKITRAFYNQLADVSRLFQRISMDANATILPALTSILRGFERAGRWVRENETIVSAFLFAIAGIITAIYLPAMLRAAAATIVAFAPLLAAAAAIAAVGTLIAAVSEDVIIFLEGGDSLLGQILNKFPAFKEGLAAIWEGWKIVWSTIKDVSALVGGALWSALKAIGNAVRDVLVADFTFLWSVIQKVISGLTSAGAVISWIFGGASKLISGAADGLSRMLGMDGASVTTTQAVQHMGTVAASPLAAVSSTAITNSRSANTSRTSNVSIGEVRLETQASDADGIAASISTSLRDQLDQLNDQLDDGVAV